MFMMAGPAAAATPELKAALRKLVRALPEPFRESAQTAATSIMIDPGGWGRTGRALRPKHLDALQAAVANAKQVRLGYSDRQGKSSTRVVHPLGLVVKGSVWYLVGGTDAGQRTFRVGRVTACEPTGEACERPPGFDLAEAWERIAANIEEMRSPYHVDAVVDADVVGILRWIFDRNLTVLREACDGGEDGTSRAVVRIGGHHVEQIAAQVAGFGARVEVTGPADARAYLRRVGEELAATYA
jgi:predicted DNA-binding transcriptional regulator YafY